MSKAQRRAARIADAFGQATPPPIANTWLITGPDWMDGGARKQLGRLLTFHGLLRAGMGQFFPDITRERWLTDKKLNRGTISMKVLYHPSKLQALHQGPLFLSLIPKSKSFGETDPEAA